MGAWHSADENDWLSFEERKGSAGAKLLANDCYTSKLKIKYICVFCIFVAIFSNFLSDYIISFLSNFEYFRKYFAWYLNSKFSTGELNLYSLLINVCILLFLIFINKNASDDADYNILLWLETLAVLSLLLSSCIPMMQRISWMFSFPLFIYLPKMFDFVTNSKLKFLLKFSVISCFILYMSITIFVKGYNEVFPYISIFH